MKRLSLILLLVFAATQLASADHPAGPNTYKWHQAFFPSKDGTMLRADVFLSSSYRPGRRYPVILSVGPYFGRNAQNRATRGPVLRFNDLIEEGRIFSRGFAYVQVDSRGYGGSGGCNDFGGPGEQSDVEAAVNWAGSQPWSTGAVGMWGKSYDAWTQVMALAENPIHLKAVVIQSPLINAYRAFYMNGVHFESGWYLTPSLYTAYDLAPTTASDPAPEEFLYPAVGTATNPDCYARNTVMPTLPDESLDHWKLRDPVALAAKSRVPTLWSHGFNDINTKPNNIFPVFSKLKGPKRAWFGQWDHVRGNQSKLVGRDGFMDEAMAWFEKYLDPRGSHNADGPVARMPAIEIQSGQGKWRAEDEWPPSDAKRTEMPMLGGEYLDAIVRPGPVPVASSFWSTTRVAPYPMHIAGEINFTASVATTEPNANLIVRVFDVDTNDSARLITKGAQLVRAAGKVSFTLWPQDWLIAKGHRIAIEVTRKDPGFTAISTGAIVTVTNPSISIPFLRGNRTTFLKGKAAQAMDWVEVIEIADQLTGRTSRAVFPPRMR